MNKKTLMALFLLFFCMIFASGCALRGTMLVLTRDCECVGIPLPASNSGRYLGLHKSIVIYSTAKKVYKAACKKVAKNPQNKQFAINLMTMVNWYATSVTESRYTDDLATIKAFEHIPKTWSDSEMNDAQLQMHSKKIALLMEQMELDVKLAATQSESVPDDGTTASQSVGDADVDESIHVNE